MKCTTPKIKKSKYANGKTFWLVTYSLDNKQRKKKFSSEREANEHKQDIIRKHQGGISTDDQDLARLALEKFRAHQTGNKELSKIDFVELVEWGIANFQAPTDEAVEILVDEFLNIKRKQGVREATIYELENYLNAFAKDFKGRKVETFTQAELEKYLNKKYKWNKNRFGIIKHFFAWLSGTSTATPNRNPVLNDTPFRGWILGRTDSDKISNIVSYTAKEAEKILKIASEPKFNAQGMFAFMLFSGVRPQEAVRIWEDTQKYGWNLINFEKSVLTIPAALTKTNRPRIIHMNDTLVAWLKKYQDFETLIPKAWLDKHWKVRKQAGVNMANDVTRHTFITQSLEQGMTFEQVAIQCGNSKDIILKHYATLSNKEDSDNFFALTPDKFKRHDIPHEEYNKKMIKERNARLMHQSNKVKKVWASKNQ